SPEAAARRAFATGGRVPRGDAGDLVIRRDEVREQPLGRLGADAAAGERCGATPGNADDLEDPPAVHRVSHSVSAAVLEVARRAVLRHLALDVAADAPAHLERRDLVDPRLFGDFAVAVGAGGGVRAEHFDVAHVRKVHEVGDGIDADPLGGRPIAPRTPDLRDLGAVTVGGAVDDLVAPDARLHRGNPRLAGNRGRVVAVHAGDAVLTGVDVVAEEYRLAGTLELPGIALAQDGGSESRSGRPALRRHRAGEQEHRDSSPPHAPLTLR